MQLRGITTLAVALILASGLTLTACGQKGPLYLPNTSTSLTGS